MARKLAFLDWRAMKYYHIRGILLPVFVAVVGLLSSPILVIPTSVLLSMFYSLNPFAVEEKGALNNLYLSLPVSRGDVVSGRFLLAGLMGLFGLLMSIPIMLLVNQFGWSHYYLPFSWYIFVLAVSYLLFAVCNLATYPALFKLGYTKGKFWGLILPAICMGLLYGGFTAVTHLPGYEGLLYDILAYASENMLLLSGGITVLATGLLLISFAASKRIYARRDF